MIRRLYFGDNLENLKKIPDEFVDFIYIDPPYYTKDKFLFRFNNKKAFGGFNDDHFKMTLDRFFVLAGDKIYRKFWASLFEFLKLRKSNMIGFLMEIGLRLIESHRVLKETGNIFVQCDHHSSHYIKIILDAIFFKKNFVNEIIWKRCNSPKAFNTVRTSLGACTDSIFFYSKTRKRFYNDIRPVDNEKIQKLFNFEDNGKQYRKKPFSGLTAGIYRSNKVRNYHYTYKGYKEKVGWSVSKEELEKLDEAGVIVFSKNGRPFKKEFIEDYTPPPRTNLWDDIFFEKNHSSITGWPTQKPIELLTRLMNYGCPGDGVVLDPYLGSGTSIIAAESSGRSWIGMEASPYAMALAQKRLAHDFGELDYEYHGENHLDKYTWSHLRKIRESEG